MVAKETTKKTTKKKITVPKRKKTTVAKSKKKTTTPKKSTVVVKSVGKPKSKAEEAKTPEKTGTAGWKKIAKEQGALLKPKVLRPKSELWDSLKQETGGRKKGVIILVKGLSKVGKTNWECTASLFKGFKGNRREIPAGSPVYILDTENAAADEADFHFAEQVDNGQILIVNCFVENPITKEIDPTKSLDKLEEWVYSLTDEVIGTICIDNYSDYCAWVYYKLVDKVLGIGFNKDGKENKSPMPIQYKWRNKKIKSFLRRLRNMPINVILVAQEKAEWASGGGGAMDGYRTGGYVADMLEGTDYWVDIIARYEKETDDNGKVIRRLVVEDSRFESENMKGRDYVLEGNPTFEGLIGLFKDLI